MRASFLLKPPEKGEEGVRHTGESVWARHVLGEKEAGLHGAGYFGGGSHRALDMGYRATSCDGPPAWPGQP